MIYSASSNFEIVFSENLYKMNTLKTHMVQYGKYQTRSYSRKK